MPSKTSDPASRRKDGNSFADDYLADWDDDPFRSPSPEPAKKNDSNEKEKKDVLGIDKQLDLKRKPRAPRVKLDEARLLSDKGIPKLRKMAPKLKFKGKGHEFSDAARLLSFYQEWLDDLFPKATLLDALAMVERIGHKTTVRNARLQWIDEGRPRAAAAENEEDYSIGQGSSAPRPPDRVAPIFENVAKTAMAPEKTPGVEDLFGDDDVYNATPRQNTGGTAPRRQIVHDDVPDLDDLDALMAEAEAESGAKTLQRGGPSHVPAPLGSIFGNGMRSAAAPGAEPDDDDMDALMAEAEAQAQPMSNRPSRPAANGNIFSDENPKQPPVLGTVGEDEDDLDALMAEAELEAQRPSEAGREKPSFTSGAQPAGKGPAPGDDDDLDALMAETEAEAGTAPSSTKGASSARADTGPQAASFEDDEEAMAEMDGLW